MKIDSLEIVEIKCSNCGKSVFVKKDYMKEKNFCTLRCLEGYKEWKR